MCHAWGNNKSTHNFSMEPEWRDSVRDRRVGGIILKCIFRNKVRDCERVKMAHISVQWSIL